MGFVQRHLRCGPQPRAVRALLGLLLVSALPFAAGRALAQSPVAAPAVSLVELKQSRQKLDEQFAERLELLAAKCDQLELPEQAATTRRWPVARPGGRQYLYLPSAKDATEPDSGAPQRARQWYAKFREERSRQADALFALARQALTAHDPALAYKLVHEVLRENPDHADARRILGYTRRTTGGATGSSAGDWLPRPASWKAETGRTDHPRLGWRRGQYWRIDTPHYGIVTNHSARVGLELAAELEDLLALWQQVFFDFWSDEVSLAARFDGLVPKEPQAAKMQVVLFKNRDEYLATLSEGQPQLALSLGLYLDAKKTAFFYAAQPPTRTTWLHEATHQLFQERGRHRAGAGEKQNFWVVEGSAMFMESLAEHDGYWTVGGWESERLQAARYRALSGDFHLPLEQLVLLGRADLQAHAEIRKLYSQAAGLTHFLLDSDDGRLRQAAIEYLRSVYQQTDEPQSLAATTKTGLAELDQQYLQFLQVTDDDVLQVPDPQRLAQLSLGRTGVTDAGLKGLAECTQLTWLDLSLTKTTDAGLSSLGAAGKLQQLFLEATQITDASLPLIGRFTELEELDLSRLQITDAGLAELGGLKKLKSLYLTSSPITDAGLPHLAPLKQLQSLDLRGTQATSAGLQRLQKLLPKTTIEGPTAAVSP